MLGHACICLDTERIPSRWLRTSPDSSEGPLSLNLTFRRFLSPLDTGPIRRLPEGLRPAAGTHGPPPARGGRLRRHAAYGPTPRGGNARQPRRRGRQRARSGRQARRGRRRDREGERAYGPTEGRSLTRRLTERRSLRPPRRAECAFPSHHRPGDAGPNPPPACGALQHS